MHPDHTKRYPLDEEMQSFLKKCAEYYPEQNGALSIEDNRRLYLSLCEAFTFPLPDGVVSSNESITANGVTIPLRRYTPQEWNQQNEKQTRVVYYHGGGFVVGNLESHHSICAELASGSGCELIAVDYRLSPEYQHPSAFDDALAAFKALDTGRTIIAGDSAGGTLAAAVCAETRNDSQRPHGQLLIYPWLGGELMDLPAYNDNADAPGLTRQDLDDYRKLRTHTDQDLTDHTYYPLALDDFTGMPPCISFAAEFDPLRDDTGAFVNKLQAAGVFAENHIESGLIHGYLRARKMSTRAAASFGQICTAIKTLADK